MADFAKKRLETSNTVPIWQLYEEACLSIGQTATWLETLYGTYDNLPGAVSLRHAASSRASQWDNAVESVFIFEGKEETVAMRKYTTSQ